MLFGAVSQEWVWALLDRLLWHQHGGSGYSMTLGDVLDLDWRALSWFADRVAEHRSTEYTAVAPQGGGR